MMTLSSQTRHRCRADNRRRRIARPTTALLQALQANRRHREEGGGNVIRVRFPRKGWPLRAVDTPPSGEPARDPSPDPHPEPPEAA